MRWSRVPAVAAAGTVVGTAAAAGVGALPSAAVADSVAHDDNDDDDGEEVARTQVCCFDVAECYYPGAGIWLLHVLTSALYLCCVLLPPTLQQPPSAMTAAAVRWWTAGLLLLSIAVGVLLFLVIVADAGFRVSTAGAMLSHRCPVCHVVVDDFDHHCGVLGACIGRGNMHYFLSWLLLAALLYGLGALLCVRCVCVVVYASGCVDALRDGRGVLRAVQLLVQRGLLTSPAPVLTLAMLAGAVYACLFTGGMGAVYLYLCIVGKHSVQRRRLRPRHGGLRGVFAGFWRPRLARRAQYTSPLPPSSQRDAHVGDTRMWCAHA